jgi:hypothetical protein
MVFVVAQIVAKWPGSAKLAALSGKRGQEHTARGPLVPTGEYSFFCEPGPEPVGLFPKARLHSDGQPTPTGKVVRAGQEAGGRLGLTFKQLKTRLN